jgi:hypothetical protein
MGTEIEREWEREWELCNRGDVHAPVVNSKEVCEVKLGSLEIGRIDRNYRIGGSTFRVAIVDNHHPDRAICERAVVDAGIPLPVQHRASWSGASSSASRSWFVYVATTDGTPQCAFAATLLKSKALPSHAVLRVERFGTASPLDARVAGLAILIDLAKKNHKLLRLHVEVFSPDSLARRRLGDALGELGFLPKLHPRLYHRTVGVDLAGSHTEVFARLRPCARRNIKQALKSPVTVDTISEPSIEPRLRSLWTETFARNGGPVAGPDWKRLLAFCNDNPELGRFVGLRRAGVDGPDGLLAFSVGRFHGDHAELSYAASTRPSDLKVPLAYPLMWDLLLWAKQQGASWFDVGGVTESNGAASRAALSGISAFKKHFSVDVIDVGDEWVLDLQPVRSAVARAVSGVAGWLRFTPAILGAILGEVTAFELPSLLM